MSLEKFRKSRMVILSGDAMAYQAARAMADNHIGAVLVNGSAGPAGIVTDRDLALAVLGGELDPKTTLLSEVMSEDIVTCDIGTDLSEAVRLMQEHSVRRVPLTERGRPVGLVTLDDLVLEGSVSPEALRSIVTAQLEVEMPQKPAGSVGPTALKTAGRKTRALMRAKMRAEAKFNPMVTAISDATRLDRGRAERALLIGACMLCRRLTPAEARHLIAQLPSILQARLDGCVDGPDRSVTTEVITEELARSLGIATERANECLQIVFRLISQSVSAGQMREVCGQLPEEMKVLFPSAA